MIDLKNVESYRENNRIEAKTALGGLPHSIWETYSAFANTLGGVILLGVREEKDKTFHTVDLPDPERLQKEFWDAINNPNKASVNILSAKDVRIETVNGDRIIVINVPKADRTYKPVYVEGNPLNTYRRNGEGDYKCTKEEYQAMVRDASIRSQDMLLLEEMGIDVFDPESVRGYRQRMRLSRPGHVWENLDDEDFLTRMGAAGIGEDGKKHPTTGGLLMFGHEYDITRIFPFYFLDYREEFDELTRWTDRVISSSGDWSGNVMDFYFRVYNKLQLDLKVPFELRNGVRVEDTPVHMALREALVNCIVNADYYGRQGVVVIKKKDRISFSNPGCFRIEVDAARGGGISDPRNSVILKLFNMIDIGERAGSGIPNIFRVWRENSWQEPEIRQTTEPDRTTLVLSFLTINSKKTSIKIGDKSRSAIKQVKRQMIIDYLTEHHEATRNELSNYLNLKSSRVRDYLKELIEEEIVIAEGETINRIYRLKS
ncbi:MAG: putative DNA binding domain-containing protein [Anaerolineaceae bacterium]|nr:putative DNA binding domain-containing protein [Anaerolineaceae bacterium]